MGHKRTQWKQREESGGHCSGGGERGGWRRTECNNGGGDKRSDPLCILKVISPKCVNGPDVERREVKTTPDF